MLSVVVPVYNEEHCLARNLRALAAHLREHHGEDFEIVAVDDGSRDGSAALLDDLAARNAAELHLGVHKNGGNLGKGAAVRRGVLAAQGDPIFFTDADLSTPLDEMERFLPRLRGGADVVIGTRKHPDADIRAPQGPLRVWLGLGYTKLVNAVLGLGFSDYTCGFKGFSRAAARAVFERGVVDGWSFDAEALFLARRLGLRVDEVPVAWRHEPRSKVRVLRDMLRSFTELASIRVRAARGKYGPLAPACRQPAG